MKQSMDKSLATLLRALQSGSDAQDASRLLGAAANILTLLTNPLNITLLTSQLLSAPLIWHRPDGLRTTIRILSVFNSASIQLVQQEEALPRPGVLSAQRGLAKEQWAIAVIKGADEKSPRWRHLCALAGLLIGFEGRGKQCIPKSLRRTLESATTKAVNLALQEGEVGSEMAANGIVMMLSHFFDLLSDHEKKNLNHDTLLPLLYQAPFFSKDGLHHGYFLSTIDADVVQSAGGKFDWSPKSSTFVMCQRMSGGPLIASLGSLSRVIAFSVEHVQNVELLATMVTDLSAFTRSLCVQWRQTKLSEIDISEEQNFLSEQALQVTLPLLWQTLRSSMFAMVVVLRSLLGRVLGDVRMPAHEAPFMAIQSLLVLRNLYFISSRMGANAFSQYTFVYLTAIDVLSQYPVQAEAFLKEVRAISTGDIPPHPLDRCHDHFFLNTAEHFTLVLPPELSEQLLIGAATPYLGLGSDHRLLEIFEAAHSVMLAVLSAPQNASILAKHLHRYIEVLFQVFPQNLSARQFRLAVKTLIRTTSPPSPISERDSLLSSTLLELVRYRLEHTSPAPFQHVVNSPPAEPSPTGDLEQPQQPRFSERAVLVLTLIDALPVLPVNQLEDWLSIVAESLSLFQDLHQLNICRERFWEILTNGEMDVDRAVLCVTWWGTRGGRETVLHGLDQRHDGPVMSGALVESGKL